MKEKSKARQCPQCGEYTCYASGGRNNKQRFKCLSCGFNETGDVKISNAQISKLNIILNFLNLCLKKGSFKFLKKLKLNNENILTPENIDKFKIVCKDNPEAFIKNKSVVLFYTNGELRYMPLNEYLKKSKFGSSGETNITKLPPGDAYNKDDMQYQNDDDDEDLDY